jgi:hypothetical protein
LEPAVEKIAKMNPINSDVRGFLRRIRKMNRGEVPARKHISTTQPVLSIPRNLVGE